MVFLLKGVVRLLLTPFIVIKNIVLYSYSHFCSSSDECVSSLRESGYYVFPEEISTNDLREFRKHFDYLMSSSELSFTGQANGRAVFQLSDNQVIDDFVELVRYKALEYFRCSDIQPELLYFQSSKPETENDNVPGGAYHMDDNKKNLKFFVYLNDVSDKNGPFDYASGTHGFFTLNKLYRWVVWELTARRSALYMPESKVFEGAGSITGKAGTIFCADTTGYHKAKVVEEGKRSVFVVSFAETRLDPYKNLKR